jgi:hypothetical protein
MILIDDGKWMTTLHYGTPTLFINKEMDKSDVWKIIEDATKEWETTSHKHLKSLYKGKRQLNKGLKI